MGGYLLPKTTILKLNVDNPVQRLSEYKDNQDILDGFLTKRFGVNPKFIKFLPGTAFYAADGVGKPYGGAGAHMSEWGRHVHMEIQIELIQAVTISATGTVRLGVLVEGMRPPAPVQWQSMSGARGATPPWFQGSGYISAAGTIVMNNLIAPGSTANVTLPVGSKIAIGVEFIRG